MSEVIGEVKKNIDFSMNRDLKDSLYFALKRTIILGDLPAGTRINEKELSDSLNISRTPIRYALNQLLHEQLVEHVPRTGMVVKGISIKDAYEIYDIRKALDTLATIKAMDKMTSADFDSLKKLLEWGEKKNKENDIDAVLENFSNFNTFIYKKSEMLRLKSIVAELRTYLVYFRDIAIRSHNRRDKALKEHWIIYRGMLNKDKEQIQMITHEHLDHSLKFIIEEMERRKIE